MYMVVKKSNILKIFRPDDFFIYLYKTFLQFFLYNTA